MQYVVDDGSQAVRKHDLAGNDRIGSFASLGFATANARTSEVRHKQTFEPDRQAISGTLKPVKIRRLIGHFVGMRCAFIVAGHGAI